MAAPLAAAPPSMHDLLLRRHRAHPPLRFKCGPHRRSEPSRFLLSSVSEDRVAVMERKEVNSYGLNGKGSGLGYEVVERGTNGSVEVVLNGNGASNGCLARYEGENGVARGNDERRR